MAAIAPLRLGKRLAGHRRKDSGQVVADAAFKMPHGSADCGFAAGGCVDFGPKRAIGMACFANVAAQGQPQHSKRIVRADDRRKFGFHIGQIPHRDGRDDRILRRKVPVEVPHAHPGGARKVLHRGTIEALFDERGANGIQNARLPRIRCGLQTKVRGLKRHLAVFPDIAAPQRE